MGIATVPKRFHTFPSNRQVYDSHISTDSLAIDEARQDQTFLKTVFSFRNIFVHLIRQCLGQKCIKMFLNSKFTTISFP